MNDIDTRIRAALHAATDRIDAQSLTPARSPLAQATASRRPPRWIAPTLAAATVAAVAVGVAFVATSNNPSSAPLPPGRAGSMSSSPSTTPETPSGSLSVSPPPVDTTVRAMPAPACVFPDEPTFCASASSYEPLWPFANYQQARAWQQSAGSGSQPWHLDAKQTALDFVRSYLRFADVTIVTSAKQSNTEAHIGVGYALPNGQPHTAAVLHLVRYGPTAYGTPGGWEVVGSDDTEFSLERPAYGSKVTSPLTAGGHITGVDENIVVVIRDQSGAAVSASSAAAAGGQHTPWTRTVAFSGTGVRAIVAYTGGHVTQHERFAIQGVHT